LRISISDDSLRALVLVVEAQPVIWSLGSGAGGDLLLLLFELLLAQVLLKGTIVVKTEGQRVLMVQERGVVQMMLGEVKRAVENVVWLKGSVST